MKSHKDKVVNQKEPHRPGSDLQIVSLDSICQEDKRIVKPGSGEAMSRRLIGLENIVSNSGEIILSGDSETGRSITFAFDERHVLYGKLRPYLNKVALPSFAGRCSTEIIPLLPNDCVTREYLALLLRRSETISAAMQDKTGSRMPRARLTTILSLKVPLPSLDEQRRIVARLNEQMAELGRLQEAVQEQIGAAKRMLAAQVDEIFASDCFEDWPVATLGDQCVKIGSGYTPLGGQRTYVGSGTPLIRSQNVHMNRFEGEGLVFVTEEQAQQMESCKVAQGDVLLNITGASIGRVCVTPGHVCPATVNQHVSIIRPKDSLNAHFLALYLSSTAFQRCIGELQAGATRQALTKKQIEGFLVPLPPLDDQEAVVRKLVAITEKCESIEQRLIELSIHISTLITKLHAAIFLEDGKRGSLTSPVPQPVGSTSE